MGRRKRVVSFPKPEAAPLPQSGAAREDARAGVPLQRQKLSAAAGLTPRNFSLRLDPGSVRQAEAIDFLQALARPIEKPLPIVRDRLGARRGRRAREFIELSEGRIVTESLLLAYAPELNPVEHIRS